MKSLSQQQIKQKELKFLQLTGFSLNQFANIYHPPLFAELSTHLPYLELNKMAISKIISLGSQGNANLKSFIYAFMHCIFNGQTKQDLLFIIKAAFLNDDWDTIQIKNSPRTSLASDQIKKLIVQFFYELNYSTHHNKIQILFNKFSIMMDIFVLLLRKILTHFKVPIANDYHSSVPTIQSYKILIDYFDLNCKNSHSLFLFYQDQFFILETKQKQLIIGVYSPDNGLLFNSRRSEIEHVQIVEPLKSENELNFATKQKKIFILNQMSQSKIIQAEADTPFFKFNQSRSSFQSNCSEQKDLYEQKNTLKQEKEEHIIENTLRRVESKKKINKSEGKSGIQNNLSQKLISLQKQKMKKSGQGKELFNKIVDTPPTTDSPPIKIQNISFQTIKSHLFQTKFLQRNKSSTNPQQKKIKINDSRIIQKKLSISPKEYEKKINPKGKKCQCKSKKMKSIKIHSNIYQINIWFVNKNHTSITSLSNHLAISNKQMYVSTKGLSAQIFCKFINNPSLQKQIQPISFKQSNISTKDQFISLRRTQPLFIEQDNSQMVTKSPISLTCFDNHKTPTFKKTLAGAPPSIPIQQIAYNKYKN